MLAHKAEDEGIAVAENIAGLTGIVNHDVIPSVVYTMPEIAGVGLTEEQAKEHGEVKVGKFPMLANSRAKTNHEPDGFVKVIADAKTDRVLGVWMIASVAGTMIAQAAQAMEFGATIRRHRLHLPRPPDPYRGAQGSGDGGDRQADPHLMKSARAKLRRWHIWLGWLVGIPVLLWVVSGLVMVVRPIEEVRGEHLLREPAPIRLPYAPIPPAVGGVRLKSLELEQRAAGPRWVITLPDGMVRLADPVQRRAASAAVGRRRGPRSDRPLHRHRQSRRRRAGPTRPSRRSSCAGRSPRGRSRWTTARISTSMPGPAKIVATRTRWWRFYDLMWGIHIMDLKSREDSHNPLVIGFAIASLVMSLLALMLLPMTLNRRRKN